MILNEKATYNNWLKIQNKKLEKTIPCDWIIVDYYGADQSTGKPIIIGEVLNTSYDDLDWSKIDEYQYYIKKS